MSGRLPEPVSYRRLYRGPAAPFIWLVVWLVMLWAANQTASRVGHQHLPF
jgi:hypothetical protein